ncbi:MAG: glycosyltransferase family 9 protein [Bacteroidales bacterium]|nr:glycosyltransferase family 9 protein [Bacteroidales bacterium]
MHLLVFRFSAMGDVALTVPVIRGVLRQNPALRITLVTPKFFAPFFNEIPRLNLVHPDFKGSHKGVKGLFLLYKQLSSENNFDGVVDLHNVLRSKILSLFFKVSGKQIATVDKDRRLKKQIIKGCSNKALMPQWMRYANVFKNYGINFSSDSEVGIIPDSEACNQVSILPEMVQSSGKMRIGIAPFAKHKLKMWGIDSAKELISMLQNDNAEVFLFGGGKEEVEELGVLASHFDYVNNMAGKISFYQEIALISKMDIMITMDSSNMHIASLVGVPVLSLWFGTHPMVGFSPYGQPDDYSLQIPKEELKCRPCTVFGKGECRFNTLECISKLTPEIVYKKIQILRQELSLK